MREYRLLISHVGKDEAIALQCVKALDIIAGEGDERFKIVPVYMESKTNGCFGDFAVWTEKAVYACDGVLAIITENTAETNVSVDGTEANVKVVYNEISLARKEHKDILVLRKEGVALESGYNLILQNVKCAFFGSIDLNDAIKSTVTDVILHAKCRFGGDPILEYAGKVGVRLIPSVIADTSAYLGRADKLKEIDDNFKEGKRVVCITGFGGMGKTTLAKMYAKAHPEEPVVLQYCSAEETSLKNAVISLGMEFDNPEFDKMTVDEKYALRLRQLGALDSRTLIIIDNFNADFGTVSNREALTELSAIEKCRFIISSRRKLKRQDVGVVEVGKLNDDELTELFYRDSHCKKTQENDDCIKELIERTNGHTMTVELSAKAVGIDENSVTPREIVDGFLSVDAVTQLDDRHDGYDEYETIYAHLRTLFNLSQIGAAQKNLLGALSFVARRGLTAGELKENVAYDTKDLIRLCALGYIAKSENEFITYSLHPLMSELAFADFAQSAEPFEKVIRFLIFEKSQTTGNDTLADLEMRMDYAEHIFGRLNKLCEQTPFVRGNLSVSCNNLGDIARAKGNIEAAEQYYKQGYDLAKAIWEETGAIGARQLLSISCRRLGDITRAKLGNLEVEEKYYEQGYKLAKAIAEETGTIGSRQDLSASWDRLGGVAASKGDIKSAEKYFRQSYELTKAIAEEMGTIESRQDLSASYAKLGAIAQGKGDIEAAEQYYKQGYDLVKAIAEETGAIEARRLLAISYERLGDIARAKGDLESSEQYHRQGYDLAKAIAEETGTIRERRLLAISCERLGGVASSKGDIESAEQYYKQGYELAKALLEETGMIESLDDLAVSNVKMSGIADSEDRAMQYLCAALDIAKNLNEQSADFLELYCVVTESWLNHMEHMAQKMLKEFEEII